MKHYQIAPSLLSANFAKLGEEVTAVLAAGADCLHLDVMDNHYVPNLTVGPLVLHALRAYGITAPIDVHLMTRPVDSLIVDFAKAGASAITIHAESTDHLDRSLSLILQHNCQAGLALNPAAPLDVLDYVLDKLNIILVMSVNPGFGGQTFIPSALDKIRKIRQRLDQTQSKTILAVDGGVTLENIKTIAEAGADRFIAGSAIFKETDYQKIITAMRQKLA